MKKVITICIALALVLSLAPAVFADVDLSGMSFDELVALKDQINRAIWNSQEWQEVTVPQGVWEVGADIPAGKWTIKAAPDSFYTSIKVGQNLSETGTNLNYPYKATEMVYWPGHPLFEKKDVTEWTVTLSEGDFVLIDDSPAIFIAYAGKPSLGFK